MCSSSSLAVIILWISKAHAVFLNKISFWVVLVPALKGGLSQVSVWANRRSQQPMCSHRVMMWQVPWGPWWVQTLWKGWAIKIGRKVVLYGKAGLDCTELQRQTGGLWVKIWPRLEGSNFSGIIRRICCKLPQVGLGCHQQLMEGSLRETTPTLSPSKSAAWLCAAFQETSELHWWHSLMKRGQRAEQEQHSAYCSQARKNDKSGHRWGRLQHPDNGGL